MIKNKTTKRLLYILITIILVVSFSYFQNNSIVTSYYTIQSDNLPPSFDGYKIVQLSDLHNKSFGKNQQYLMKRVQNANPDVIVFTGDLVDADKYNEEPSLVFMEELFEIAPVYFVTGNHEWWSGKFYSLEVKLEKIGVNVLRNTTTKIERDNDFITIIGIDDPANRENSFSELARTEKNINESIESQTDYIGFKLLLAHRPEMFSLYAKYDFDLVLSGHAHGGQFRIPFVGGFVAPNQGFLPEYTAGMYRSENTTMIVNRGLGNSIIPQRLFNRPEIVVVTLVSE
ncbi:MAG: metallophosphoesterase [Bacillus sp. (in: Bacteria)]|nr:metallophosphoesterase [Bacillus sp. (in: firmicutes)]